MNVFRATPAAIQTTSVREGLSYFNKTIGMEVERPGAKLTCLQARSVSQ